MPIHSASAPPVLLFPRHFHVRALCLMGLLLLGNTAVHAVTYPDVAEAKVGHSGATLGNGWISIEVDPHLRSMTIDAPPVARHVSLGNAFLLGMKDGQELSPAEMSVISPLRIEALDANPSASRAAARMPGKEVCTKLAIPGDLGSLRWCAILRNGSKYIRQEISLQAEDVPVPISGIYLLKFNDPGARVDGTVTGSPIVDSTMFFGFEHPLAISSVTGNQVVSMLPRVLPLAPRQLIAYSSVIGVAPPGQLRRSFLAYVERERAHPYRTFLHYNTWYDLGYGNRYNEAGALDRIHAFGEELTRKRHVVMDSFLFDDGWDNSHTVWGFNAGFPDGFTRVRAAAASYGFGIGVWLSPWGGYQQARLDRVAVGRKEGYEIVKNGFALSGSKYYNKFEQTCLDMIRKYGVNQFKFDGTGNANQVFPGSSFDSDFDAAIHLIQRLREASPNLFVNLTTGTYPSPFWLRYADSIWRGGMDHSFAGVGTWRQRWITYRDAQTYKNVVQAGPLFPLNSLMLHGIIYAQKADHLESDPGHDFTDEVHSYFGTGTQLQEMYITPSLLSQHDWDVLAEAANWSRANASVLSDTHWIGGDPGQLQVYGWAAWKANRGILVLRNPSDKPAEIVIDIGEAFELPAGSARVYRMDSPWKADAGHSAVRLEAGKPHSFQLQPFQVLTLQGVGID